MTEAEKIEYTKLKHIRAERGFWTDEEKKRFDELHIMHRAELKKKLQKLDKVLDEVRLMRLN